MNHIKANLQLPLTAQSAWGNVAKLGT